MTFSSVGKKKVAVHIALYFVNIIVLALAARVNLFQEFFCESFELKFLVRFDIFSQDAADLFPLGLSITSLVILTVMYASVVLILT